MTLPEVSPLKIEKDNPKFRIVEMFDNEYKITLYYPQRKLLGLLWVGMITQYRSRRRQLTEKRYCTSLSDAVAFIQKYQQKKQKPKQIIHYL